MTDASKGGKLTPGDRLMARALRWAPWLSFFVVALPFPLLFLLLYFITTTDAALYLLLALSSLAIGSIAGIIVLIFLLLYRRGWERRLRERLASGGITANELDWFMPELTTAERQALKSMGQQNPLLADAYRETLAARLTAARVISSAKRELVAVERRLNRVRLIQGTDTTSLQEELLADRTRLEQVRREGSERRAEAEARLQMIEAAASRGASWTETNFALQRLDATHEHMPLALEEARLEQQAREDAEREVRESDELLNH